MLLTIEPRDNLAMSENYLERLYLIQYLKEILDSLKSQQSNSLSAEKLNTLYCFLQSGKAHYEGQFINFKALDTAEIYSLINKSLTTEQILNHPLKYNIDKLLEIIQSINSINEDEKSLLTNFLSNLINSLSVQNVQTIQNKRNFFDW